MTEKDKKEIQEMINKPSHGISSKVLDTLWRGVSTLSLMLIVWTLNTVNELKQDKKVDDVERAYLKTSIDEIKLSVKEFTEIPRFTEQNYNKSVQPLKNQANLNTAAIKVNTDFLYDLQTRVSKLEK